MSASFRSPCVPEHRTFSDPSVVIISSLALYITFFVSSLYFFNLRFRLLYLTARSPIRLKTDHLAKDHVSFLRAKIVSHNLRACTLTMDIYIIPVHSLCIERWCTILVYWVKEASVHCPLFRPTPRFLPKFQSPGRGSIHLHRV